MFNLFLDVLILVLSLYLLVRIFINIRGGILKKLKYPKVQCGRCGNCCRIPFVPVTHKDLLRLMKATGKTAKQIVRFCSFSEMEFDAESGLWISFKSGRRAMILRKKSGRCMFQTAKRACAEYEARPQTCRTFPYDVTFEDSKNDAAEEIALNTVLPCNAVKCAKIDLEKLLADVRKENREDREYHKLVKAWNAQEEKGGTEDFLRYIL